ncbi:MAG: hypothetical protein RJB13_1941 [Pseudomonadota bacterium]
MKIIHWMTQHSGQLRIQPEILLKYICAFSLIITMSSTYADLQKKQQEIVQGKLAQWQAFGSGCRASSESPGEFVVTSIIKESRLVVQFKPHKFGLALKKGLQGVRECALRLNVEPAPKHKIKTIHARALLEATKSDGDRIRSRILLLLGDSLIARREWDLQKNEFARNRNEETVIFPEPVTMNFFKQSHCGQPQIVGIDFTFEGVRNNEKPKNLSDEKGTSTEGGGHRDEESVLRLQPSHPTTIEIVFEKCET